MINFIAKFQNDPIILCSCHFDIHKIIKMDHLAISCFNSKHRNDDALFFHFTVRNPAVPHPVDPCFFKPADIVGMMYDAHLVRFIILYSVCIHTKSTPYQISP